MRTQTIGLNLPGYKKHNYKKGRNRKEGTSIANQMFQPQYYDSLS